MKTRYQKRFLLNTGSFALRIQEKLKSTDNDSRKHKLNAFNDKGGAAWTE